MAGPRIWDVLSMPGEMRDGALPAGAGGADLQRAKVVDGLAQQGLLPPGFKDYEMVGAVERLEFDRTRALTDNL